MSKTHIIDLNIRNNSSGTLVYSNAWFQTGRLADGASWPPTIANSATAQVQCYESDWSPVGCSGWVEYTLNDGPIFFSFSNPVAGKNGIDVGTATSIWDDMGGHYFPVERPIQLSNGTWLNVTIDSTGGDTNNATWDVELCDVATIQPANLELANVEQVWSSLPSTGTRRYFRCDDPPTGLVGIALSHFKGLSVYADKFIFTHTNLPLILPNQNGRYMIADRLGDQRWDQATVDATLDTLHPGWAHPCSSQACGSFMAMGIQQTADSNVSEIQVMDIRMTRVNQAATLLGTIPIPDDGVNGVGMTRETGPDGHYIVAGINGTTLNVYRSATSSLIANGVPTVQFERILQQTIEDSGPGLALVTQQGDGAIYMFALNADAGEDNNEVNLYKLDIQNRTCTRVGTRHVQIPGMSDSVTLLEEYATALGGWAGGLLAENGAPFLNSSFRYGKGLAITSPTTIEVYASDRNVLPLSQLPVVGSDKDFSVVTWSSEPSGTFTPVYAQGDPGNGIGGYDLRSPADRVFAFDFDGSGRLDHLALYRPGTGTIWILKQTAGTFSAVYAQGDPGNGIGGYDLGSPADQAFAFDFDHSGKLDHLVLYRPGAGAIFIVKNNGGVFTPVYAQGDPGGGIGGYDLLSPADRAFAFDYDHSGNPDHIALYRPGTGTMWILKNAGGTFTQVYAQGDPGQGIGGYDLGSSADHAFAFDYDHSGKLDHLVLYRPGTGTIWILKQTAGTFSAVFAEGDPGNGIGGYDLSSPADRAFAIDYDGTGKLDHIALYRPGTGTIWILKNDGGSFSPVYAAGDPGSGIGGYDLLSPADRAFAFDYDQTGRLDYLSLYRPGTGTIWILKRV